MTTAVLATPPFLAFYDADGEPLSGGLVYTYAAGTTTPKATFTDVTATVEMSNPIVLDSAGRATWWINGAYKYVIKDSLGNTIKTTDNVTSFNTLADSEDAFFQSFSGDGTTTAFTLSQSLGTDEKGLMVFVNKGLQSNVTNGTFATDSDWTKGAGWTIAAGVATATGAISTALSQTAPVTLVEGQAYALTYVATRSAGGIIPSIGGTSGTERTASGTYKEIIIAGSSQTIAFTGNAFTGTVDTVTITPAVSAGYDILAPTAFTVNGTALTLATAPASGTNNIYVFAPSTLLGAASAAASLAQSYATDALTSATEAAASAAQAAVTAKWRPLVACATTANIILSGEQTIDGVLTSASRVLVKDQTAQAENGVYVSGAGAWTRATDADSWDELVGQAVTVSAGTTNAQRSYGNTNETGGTLGTTAVTWTQIYFYPSIGTMSSVTPVVGDSLIISDASDSGLSKRALVSSVLSLIAKTNNFRLTLSTGVPVTTSDVTGATTIYCTPYNGNAIALYDGTNWNLRTSAEFSLALGTLSSGKPYDVFCYDNSGTPTLEFLVWTNDTTRATALTYQDGVLVKTGATTRRYLGTFYTTSTTATEDSAQNRYLWNYYNRCERSLKRVDATTTWTYTTATFRQANGSTANQVNFVIGVAEDRIGLSLVSTRENPNSVNSAVALALDSTTTRSGVSGYAQNVAGGYSTNSAYYNEFPAAGRHYIAWLEWSAASGTTTWYGTSTNFTSGISGSMLG